MHAFPIHDSGFREQIGPVGKGAPLSGDTVSKRRFVQINLFDDPPTRAGPVLDFCARVVKFVELNAVTNIV